MGLLTEDLTRLRDEILALRSGRQGLIHDLEQESGDRHAAVSEMLADFSQGFGAFARRTKADRLGSISDLKRTISGLRAEVRTDLSGIRLAWQALGTPSRRAAEKLEVQARVEAIANAGGESQTDAKLPPAPAGGQKAVRKKRKH